MQAIIESVLAKYQETPGESVIIASHLNSTDSNDIFLRERCMHFAQKTAAKVEKIKTVEKFCSCK